MRKNTGKEFEEAIIDMCEVYESMGIARVKKTNQLTKNIWNPKKKETRIIYSNEPYEGNPWLDFAGVYTPKNTYERKPFLLECKHHNANTLPIELEKKSRSKSKFNGISYYQVQAIKGWIDYLDVLILWCRDGEVRKKNGESVLECFAEKKKSIHWSTFIPVENYDFLGLL